MLRFISNRVVPPGNMYFFEVPETKVVFKHPSWMTLVKQVQAHYHENGLEVPKNLDALIEDGMCRVLPEGFCHGDDEGRPRRKAVTMSSIRKATMELAAGNDRVTPGEAERRARTCANCPLNDKTACTSCTGMQAWARKLAGRSVMGLDSALGICQVDCTALSAKVHMSEIPEDEDYPDNCWRKTHDG